MTGGFEVERIDDVMPGIGLPNSKCKKNSKTAMLMRDDDCWQLLHEYSHSGHSLISLTDGPGPAGSWQEQPDPFAPRTDKWDSWRLSSDIGKVTDSCDEPLIGPPLNPSGSLDISFVAPVVDNRGTIWLYYSRGERELKRATIRRRN